MEKTRKFSILLCCLLVFISVFVFVGCSGDKDFDNDSNSSSSSTVRTVKLTDRNISNYLGIKYSVEKTPYESNTQTKYVNHEYSAETYSLNKSSYTFKNVVVVIGVSGNTEQNSLSSDGYGSFYFINHGPIRSTMTPHKPSFKKVISGYVEIR